MDKNKQLLHSGKTISFIDIESTGFSSESNQAIEVAGIKVENFPFGLVTEFSELIYAENIPDHIAALTGLTVEDVENARFEVDVLESFSKFLSGTEVYVGHNIDVFDLRFLEERGCNLGDSYETFDTLSASKVMYPDLSSHSLASMVDALSIPIPSTHRALDDVKVTIRLYKHLAEFEPDDDAERLIKLQKLIKQTQTEFDAVSWKLFNKMKKESTRAIMTSEGVAVNCSPPKVRRTFNSSKFQKEYKGDMTPFQKETKRFDKSLVESFDKKLYDTYVEESQLAPEMSIRELVKKKGL